MEQKPEAESSAIEELIKRECDGYKRDAARGGAYHTTRMAEADRILIFRAFVVLCFMPSAFDASSAAGVQPEWRS